MNNTDSTHAPLGASIQASPAGRRFIEAQVAAATSGAPMWVLQYALTTIIALLAAAAAGVTAYGVVAALGGEDGGWLVAGFAVCFSLPLVLVLTMQLAFLRRLRATRP